MAGVLRYSMSVRNPDTLEAVSLLKGESVPDWAMDGLVHADDLESASAAKADSSDKGYAGRSPDELKALAEERQLEVDGSGKDGNVLKGDLVAALEADDAAKAS